MSEKEKKLQLSYSLLRILACLSVVFHHYIASGEYQMLFSEKWMYDIFLVVENILMCNNVLFFMMSGKFAISGYKGDVKNYYRKKLKTIGIPFLTASIVIYIVFYMITGNGVTLGNVANANSPAIISMASFLGRSAGDFFIKFIAGSIEGYFWFIYALAIFYLLVPFLAAMLKNLSVKECRFFTGILLVVITSGNIYKITGTNFPFKTFMFYNQLSFCVLGYMIDRIEIKRESEKYVYILSVLALVISSIELIYFPHRNSAIFGLCLTRIFLSMGIYIAVTRHTEKFCEKFAKYIIPISACTLYIYLYHMLAEKFVFIFCFTWLKKFGIILNAIMGGLIVFAISLLWAAMLNGLKKWIRI